MKLTIFIMNAVQSPVFIAFCSRADKVGLRFFCFVHDPATKSSKFPSVRWFLKRPGVDAPHVFKAGIFFHGLQYSDKSSNDQAVLMRW